VRRSNPTRIWGAEVKAALGLILAEPSIDGLAPFVPEVGHGNPSEAWQHLLRASDRTIRHRPRMNLLQEVTVNRAEHYVRSSKGLSLLISTDLAALGAGDVLIVNVETVRSRFVVCFAWFDNERFVLYLYCSWTIRLSRSELQLELLDLSTSFDFLN
jgi:hypothetical protein